MIFFVIVVIIFIVLYAIVRSNKDNPVREDTHQYSVSLVKHDYRMSVITVDTYHAINQKFNKGLSKFLWFDITDDRHRPVGSMLSWRYQDSLNWYNEAKQFKNRKRVRKSSVGSISDPIGWTQRYTTKKKPFKILSHSNNDTKQHLFERGHLVPYCVTQNETDQKNLIPITQYTNKGFEGDDNSQLSFGAINSEAMLSIESELRRFVLSKDLKSRLGKEDIFQMYVEPVYNDISYVPIRINYYFRLVTETRSSRSFSFYGQAVSQHKILKISVPVQMSDGTIAKIIKHD